ncbi:hypothetical protein EK0264_10870 [Epidermidibacterium keratini]|uniref:Uncharacterized protein n=1 Tax=Epidermidibacterium keratini TaxID=1891644 RepID=A0A7L4YN81_9ACTN|nr:hypothetical protein [Epidermidibacterium keratini]QHC00741.1 hypothetical protein EK0264_10870 [Epidermidibacterium keratini]
MSENSQHDRRDDEIEKEVAELSETPQQAAAEQRATDRDAKDDVGYDIEQADPDIVAEREKEQGIS